METPLQARSLTAIALQGIGTRVRFQLLLWPVVHLLLLACLGSWLRYFCWRWDPAKVSWPTQSPWPMGGWGRRLDLWLPGGLTSGKLTLCGSVGQSCLTLCDPMDCRLPCPSSSSGVRSNSCLLSQWCHPTISSSAAPFSCPQSSPASGSLPMSLYQVAKISEFQLQHQSFQWIFF